MLGELRQRSPRASTHRQSTRWPSAPSLQGCGRRARHLRCIFTCYDIRVEIGPTALKRKWTRDDILHALEHRHIDYDIEDDDPPRTWVFGFARDLTLLELLILHDTPGGRVIHCTKARPKELEKALRARGRR